MAARRKSSKKRNRPKPSTRKSSESPASRVSQSGSPAPGNSTAGNNPAAGNTTPLRNRSLDAIRGIAIVLMIVDHTAGMLFHHLLQESTVRLVTRLSMPLFCVLMGYFLRERESVPWKRVGQIALASLMVNAIFFTKYGRIEILGSLLLAYLLFLAVGRLMPLFVFGILFYMDDPLKGIFDYPPTIVVSFVAVGAILRHFGVGIASAAALLLTFGSVAIHHLEPMGINHMMCYFILPATLIVHLGAIKPNLGIPWPERGKAPSPPGAPQRWTDFSPATLGLSWIGRYPLTCYVVQYYVLFSLVLLKR